MVRKKMLSEKERIQLLVFVNKHKYLKSIPSEQVENAINTLEKCLLGEYFFLEGQALLSIRKSGKVTKALNLLDDILPALVFANRYFGKKLPVELVQKLSNIPQIEDTIFELKCMGMFLDKHKIVYEPELSTGKIPEFKIIVKDNPEIYVECKSQGQETAVHMVKFNSVVNRLMEPLNKSPFLKRAWEKGYRTEVFPLAYIHDKEAGDCLNNLKRIQFEDCLGVGEKITEHIVVSCVPRDQESLSKTAIKTGSITVSDKSTQLSHRNTHLMIHAWDGVELQSRRSKRRLLSEARRKLKNIPDNSVGMICIQTYGASHFQPDIERLVGQKQYERISLIWLNPFHEGKIICRNEFLPLRNTVFQGMIK